LALTFPACSTAPLSTSEASVGASNNPKLLRAVDTFVQEGDAPYRGFAADILVPHVGKTKAVRIVGNNEHTGATFTFDGFYTGPASADNELWAVRAHLTNVFDTDFSPIDFTVEQVVDGTRTVDDNGGRRYIFTAETDSMRDEAVYVRGGFVLARDCIGLSDGSDEGFGNVSCELSMNPTVPQGGKLTIIYTSDARPEASTTVNCSAFAYCGVSLAVPLTKVFKYHLTYVAGGSTYHDDNFGHGYQIDANHRSAVYPYNYVSTGAARYF
jgi:hypothetical protein